MYLEIPRYLTTNTVLLMMESIFENSTILTSKTVLLVVTIAKNLENSKYILKTNAYSLLMTKI